MKGGTKTTISVLVAVLIIVVLLAVGMINIDISGIISGILGLFGL